MFKALWVLNNCCHDNPVRMCLLQKKTAYSACQTHSWIALVWTVSRINWRTNSLGLLACTLFCFKIKNISKLYKKKLSMVYCLKSQMDGCHCEQVDHLFFRKKTQTTMENQKDTWLCLESCDWITHSQKKMFVSTPWQWKFGFLEHIEWKQEYLWMFLKYLYFLYKFNI